MRFIKVTVVSILLGAFLGKLAGASEVTAKSDDFKPFLLVGAWTFTSNSSGARYGGDVKVNVTSIEANGLMRGKISYDGRQTSDSCSTKGVFSDDPVDVEVFKGTNEYKISFNIKCSSGESPRLRSWTLTCEKDTCTRPEILPNGSGLLTLNEKR